MANDPVKQPVPSGEPATTSRLATADEVTAWLRENRLSGEVAPTAEQMVADGYLDPVIINGRTGFTSHELNKCAVRRLKGDPTAVRPRPPRGRSRAADSPRRAEGDT
jgi:hypothetical protein